MMASSLLQMRSSVVASMKTLWSEPCQQMTSRLSCSLLIRRLGYQVIYTAALVHWVLYHQGHRWKDIFHHAFCLSFSVHAIAVPDSCLTTMPQTNESGWAMDDLALYRASWKVCPCCHEFILVVEFAADSCCLTSGCAPAVYIW